LYTYMRAHTHTHTHMYTHKCPAQVMETLHTPMVM